MAGFRFLSARATPTNVPAVPIDATNASTAPPVCSQISGPVVSSCASNPLRLLNWSGRNACSSSVSSAARLLHQLQILAADLARNASGRLRHEDDVRSERPKHPLALDAVALGHHRMETIAAHGSDDGESDAGVAAGQLHDRTAGLQPTLVLGIFDHPKRDAILHAAAGAEAFQLGQHEPG